jgi:dTDP-glucose 4,6-dehydratase
MNLLVTGGCGFIGSNFIRQLLVKTVSPLRKLVNIDKITYAGNPANIEDCADDPRYVFVNGDIANGALISCLLSEHHIDAIVNFAAETHVDRSIDSPEMFVQTNVVGLMHLLNATRQYWAKLSEPIKSKFRFQHISTDEVYGSLAPNAPPVTEHTLFAPNSPYAASKAAGDHLVRAYWKTYGLPTLTLNCSNNYGPYQFPEKLIPLVILNALESRPLPIYGDGQQKRDWIYVEDNANAVWQILQHGCIGETYNVGGGAERTNLETVRQICFLLDAKISRKDRRSYATQITFVPDRPGHDQRYATDFSKLKRELGWTLKTSFEAGLAKTVDWYLTHRKWCDDITVGTYARERLGQSSTHP